MLPLDNILVLDLTTGPAGGLATMMLADFGARVLRLEIPETHVAAPMWQRGKKIVDFNDITSHFAQADVVVATSPEESCQFENLHQLNPNMVYCEITAMGEDSRMPLYEPVVTAKAGRMKTMEGIHPLPGPVFAAVPVATHACAQNAVTGILSALLERDRSGEGQKIHTSLLQGLMPYDMAGSLGLQMRERRGLPPSVMDPFTIMPSLNYHPVQCQDGKWIQLGNLLPHLFNSFMQVIGLEDLLTREVELETIREKILERMQTKTSAEWMGLFIEDGGVACHRYQSAEQALTDPDMVDNGHVIELDGVKQLGPVANLTKTPAQPGSIKDCDSSFQFKVVADTLKRDEAPLSGVTVLELATIIAAPLGASFLSDLGARVIKVEAIGGDSFRNMGGGGLGAYRVNQGKESIGLDLKSEAGQKIVRQLVLKADLLIHNYRPGVPERLGIDYEAMAKINPGLVYLASNGYGPKGPGAFRPSTHPIPGAALGGAGYQAGGLTESLLKMPELREATRRLMRANEVNPDPNTAMVVATSALLGLMARRRSGEGQQIFIDMFGANAYANFDDFIDYEGKLPRPALDDNLKGISPRCRLYQCATGWVFLGVQNEDDWLSFCERAAFDTQSTNLEVDLKALFSTRSAEAWETLLAGKGIGCVEADRFNMSEFFFNDCKAESPRWMINVDCNALGDYYRHKSMIDFSRSKLSLKGSVKGGADCEALLLELGYSESGIAELLANGVLWRA